MTQTRYDTGDPAVDDALADLAATDPTTADLAADGFTGLTWGSGLKAVSLRGLQDYLWYQMPYKHGQPPDEQRATTDALAILFDRLDLHRYANTCRSPTTDQVLAAYAADDNAGLTEKLLPLLDVDQQEPDDAEQHLTQIRWFLAQCDGDGAQLTVNHTLSRALLTEACHRFNWLILGKQAPPENQLPEAHHLRGIADQLGATRRRGRRLLLTTRGRQLLDADTPTLWAAVTAALIPTEPAEAAAAEIMLMLLVTGPPPRYDSPTVADALTGEGWTTDAGPLTRDRTGWLTGPLFGRLDFLGLQDKPTLTGRSPLTPAGHAAALNALRHRAHAPRQHP
jgi:hypothetical protein